VVDLEHTPIISLFGQRKGGRVKTCPEDHELSETSAVCQREPLGENAVADDRHEYDCVGGFR
jgi:hypothetical protein